MKIVIEVPDEFYNKMIYQNGMSVCEAETVVNAFYRGTPLPKGHGRLIDADALKKARHDIHIEEIHYRHRCVSVENIDEAPTIIEADKEGAEE